MAIDPPLASALAQAIERKLARALAPQALEVIDESHLHVGHAGYREGGQTHFRIKIVSDRFTGKTRLERHRMINELLGPELAAGIHALAIRATAPGE